MSGKKAKDDNPLTLSALKKILDDRLGPILEDRLKTILNESLDERLGEMKVFKKEVDDLKERMVRQEKNSEDSEKYLRCSNLVFYGIPYQSGEDPLQKAFDIIRGVNVEIEPRDLDAAHRLRTRNGSVPAPFIIRFVNRWKKEDVFAEFKSQQPTANRWGGDRRVRVFCNEQLLPLNQTIMYEAKKYGEYYSVWAFRSQIYCRKKLPNCEPVQLLDIKAAQTLGSMLSEEEKKMIRSANQNQNQRRQQPNGPHPGSTGSRENGEGDKLNNQADERNTDQSRGQKVS